MLGQGKDESNTLLSSRLPFKRRKVKSWQNYKLTVCRWLSTLYHNCVQKIFTYIYMDWKTHNLRTIANEIVSNCYLYFQIGSVCESLSPCGSNYCTDACNSLGYKCFDCDTPKHVLSKDPFCKAGKILNVHNQHYTTSS